MPSIEDLIVDDLARLRQARSQGNEPAVKLLTATLNRRLDSLTVTGQG